MQNFEIPIPGAVEDHRSDYSLSLWNLIIDLVGPRGEIKEPVLADKLGCSPRLVRWILKGFQRCNLIKVESYNGQGRGIKIVNFWLEKAEKIKQRFHWRRAHQKEREYLRTRNGRNSQLGRNPLDCLGIPSGVLTKGSRPTKFLMYKLRTFLEDTHLSHCSGVICGKIFNHLRGKTASEGRQWLSRLKRAVKVNWTLTDFFVWFHDFARSEQKQQEQLSRSRQQRQKRKRRKERARKSFKKNPPPRSRDYDTIDEYVKAMEVWNEKRGCSNGDAGGQTRD